MRRDTVLGGAVHVPRADLDLVQLPARTEYGRVERLVAVGLGTRDVVLDPLLQRRPGMVDDAEDVITVRDTVHEHPHGQEVVDLFERLAALLHLLENRPEVLGATHHVPPYDPRAAEL